MWTSLLIVLSLYVHHGATECRVYLNGNLTQDKPPLFLQSTGTGYGLLQPKGSYFQWRTGETALVGCSAGKNRLQSSNTPVESFTCANQQQFRAARSESYLSTELNCTSVVAGAIKSQGRDCAGGTGRLYDLGFDINSLPFVRYFQACYNEKSSSAIYTEHSIVGQSVDGAQVTNSRPSFKVGGVSSNISIASAYTQRSQKERFTELLGSGDLASKYITTNSFLAKGHLTPDGDAILSTWAAATYFYINAAPEWQSINVGNWVRVENLARKLAAKLNDTLEVYTGVYDILRLPNAQGNPVPISLGEHGQLEVPKWFWKVVKHSASRSAIALVTLNNPFATTGVVPLCRDICTQHGWQHKEFQDVHKGFTYCCSVQDLRKSVAHLPSNAVVPNVLTFSQ